MLPCNLTNGELRNRREKNGFLDLCQPFNKMTGWRNQKHNLKVYDDALSFLLSLHNCIVKGYPVEVTTTKKQNSILAFNISPSNVT